MTVIRETTINRYIGLSSDTKPTSVPVGSTYYEYNTGEMYVTHDGTSWVKKDSVVSTRLGASSATKKIPTANAYAVGNVVSESETQGTVWTFNTMALSNGGGGYIVGARIISQATNVTPRVVLDLYSSTPTSAVNDHVASTGLVWADASNYIGTISFEAWANVGTGSSHALASPSTYGGLPIAYNCATNSTAVTGVVVTKDAWTPIANNSVMIALEMQLN